MTMGIGVDLARQDAPLHAAVIDNFKDQLLIAFIRRLGGNVTIPVAEVDQTGSFVVSLRIDGGDFVFELRKKN